MRTQTTDQTDLAPKLPTNGPIRAIRTLLHSNGETDIMLVGRRGAQYGPFRSEDDAVRFADFVASYPRKRGN